VHSTTALYELKLWPEKTGKLATTFIRYKDPDTFKVSEISSTFNTDKIAKGAETISKSFTLASIVTEFAEILRESYWAKGADLSATLTHAEQYCRDNPQDTDAAELKDLIARAVNLLKNKPQPLPQPTPLDDTPAADLTPADIQYQQKP
jgi:Ca-activated chloride channel family protein